MQLEMDLVFVVFTVSLWQGYFLDEMLLGGSVRCLLDNSKEFEGCSFMVKFPFR
jgi:hypothetical protein